MENKDKWMMEHDLHKWTASKIFETNFDKVDSTQRNYGKRLNYILLHHQGVDMTGFEVGVYIPEQALATVKTMVELITTKQYVPILGEE